MLLNSIDKCNSTYLYSSIELGRTLIQHYKDEYFSRRHQRTHLPLILRNGAVGCTNMDDDLLDVELRAAKNGRRSGWPR